MHIDTDQSDTIPTREWESMPPALRNIHDVLALSESAYRKSELTLRQCEEISRREAARVQRLIVEVGA